MASSFWEDYSNTFSKFGHIDININKYAYINKALCNPKYDPMIFNYKIPKSYKIYRSLELHFLSKSLQLSAFFGVFTELYCLYFCDRCAI